VAFGWWPVSLDHAIAQRPCQDSTPPGSRHSSCTSSAITTLATPHATVLITATVAAWLPRRDATRAALRTVAVPLAALTLSVLAGKALLHQAGPPRSHLNPLLGYHSSGHTTTALVCTGLLTCLAPVPRPEWLTRLRTPATTWDLLVGPSLVFHRHHWLTDVLAGLLLGSLIMLITQPNRRRQVPESAPLTRVGLVVSLGARGAIRERAGPSWPGAWPGSPDPARPSRRHLQPGGHAKAHCLATARAGVAWPISPLSPSGAASAARVVWPPLRRTLGNGYVPYESGRSLAPEDRLNAARSPRTAAGCQDAFLIEGGADGA
jgi:membrane-associated phospholipid phosphatase